MVETGDISVEALGTEFNVFSRRSRTQVVLNSGKLKLDFQSRKIEQEIILQPGEMVEYEATNDEYNRTLVEPENYSSWKEHKLVFDNSSLLEITQQVEDIYGYKIKYGPEVDMNRKLSGTIPNDDIQVLLRALEYYGINIIYDENLNPD
jgi:ferric-dicitrate binding protein FerR (iron transport regulator)